MKHLFTLLLLTLTFDISHAQWTKTEGPYQSNIISFAENNDSLYAVDQGFGVFLSTDNGASWTSMRNGLPTSFTVFHDMTIADNDMFLGTDQGAFLSSDGGANWTAINTGFAANTKVYVLLKDRNTVYAGTRDGIYTTINNGGNWAFASTGMPANTRIGALAIRDSIVFAGTSQGIFTTTDNGANWTIRNNGLPSSIFVYSMAVSGTNIYAGTSDGVYLSTDDGNSWIARNNGLLHKFGLSLYTTGGQVYAGSASGLFVSSNAGTNWTQIKNGETNLVSDRNRTDAVWTEGTTIFSGGNEGVSVSADTGKTWTLHNKGFPFIDISSLATNGDRVYIGAHRGLFVTKDNGSTWESLANAWISTLKAQGTHIYIGNTPGLIYASSDNGQNWAQGLGFSDNGQDVFAVAGNTVFAKYNSLVTGTGYLSTDYGASFNRYDFSYSLFANRDDTTLFAVDSTIVQYTGGVWTPVSSVLMDTATSLAVNGTTLFVGTKGGVLTSPHNGSQWQKVNVGSPTAVITYLAVQGPKVYATTSDNQIFASVNNGNTWFDFTDNFADSIIGKRPFRLQGTHMLINDTHIFIGAKDGVWVRPLSELVGLSPEIENDPFIIYPNPSEGIFTIKGEKVNAVIVRDVLGKMVYQTPGSNNSSTTIDLSHFPSGVYLVTIEHADMAYTKKVVIR